MLHLWVDPYFGDDVLADDDLVQNPGGFGSLNPDGTDSFTWCPPQAIPPRPHQVVNAAGNVLLHAPHPFKTITAAVNYIVATNPSGAAPLPAPGGISGFDWQHAIIHLMPGRYGQSPLPSPPQQTFGDPENGETFPIHLPPNVSVQGTSALNTQLVLTDGNAPAFEFGVNQFFASAQRTVAINGVNTFIDGVTITGGVENVREISATRAQMCGVWIADDVASRPTITNCIVHGLWVGVGIGASLEPGVEHHGVTLVNNTIAWNRIGLWNGVDADSAAVGATGRSRINVLNCLFDATPPGGTCGPADWQRIRNGSLCFEGLSQEDMRVSIGGAFRDTNAWENGKENQGGVILQQFAAVQPRLTNPASPRVDLSPITGAQAFGPPLQDRGVLFVRDLLCRSQFAGPGGFDRSPHDFRLSPNIALADPSTEQALTLLNPVVEAGFSASGFSTGPMVFENTNQLTDPPGTLPLDEEGQAAWPFHTWEFDLEGYGNPRIADHPAYPNPAFGAVDGDTIDIGADEVGQLIVAGYQDRTTEFRREGASIENHRGWLLGPITGATFDRWAPLYRSGINLAMPFPLAAYNPNNPTWSANPPRKATDSMPVPLPPQTTPPLSVIYPATVADITPHLPPDAHPWWPMAFAPALGVPPALTLWEECLGANHNSSLYLHPSSARINPPGAATGTFAGLVWLDGRNFLGVSPPSVQVYGLWSSFAIIDHFDSVCRAVDTINGTNGVIHPSTVDGSAPNASTIRFTLEFGSTAIHPDAGLLFDMPSNLQTFTVWHDEDRN